MITMLPSTTIRVLDEPMALFEAAAATFVQATQQAVQRQGRCTVALAGGSTPRGLYTLLCTTFAADVPWESIVWFWGDERYLSRSHPDSNYRMAHEALLSRVPVRADAIFPIETDRADAADAASAYERALRQGMRLPPGALPHLDLVLLGMGADGHTASLFPGSAALGESSRLVVASTVPATGAQRITLTLPVLNNAAFVLFLVSGREKQTAVQSVLGHGRPSIALPASMVRPTTGQLTWLLDREAAGPSLPRRACG